MTTTTYLKFKGALYRKAWQPPFTKAPGKVLKWGPGEWPTDEYLESMSEKPPTNRQEYDFLLQTKQELLQNLSSTDDPVEQKLLYKNLRAIENKLMATRVWLSDRRPDDYRLKHWAKSK